MKFRCDRDDLSEALQTVQRGVSARPGIPALTGVHIEAGEEGTLVLTTTDLEVSARLGLPVTVQEPGIILVPARLLGDMVKSLPEAPVELDADQSQARIRCASFEGTLRLLPAEDFPSWQEPSGTRVTVEAAGFAEAVGQVGRAASKDEARPTLTGVLLAARPRPSCRSGRWPRPAGPPAGWRRATSSCSWTSRRWRSGWGR